MTSTLISERASRRQLFEQITLGRSTQPVTIDVLNEEIGDQTEAARMPLQSIDYDDRGDVIIVAVRGAVVGRAAHRRPERHRDARYVPRRRGRVGKQRAAQG